MTGTARGPAGPAGDGPVSPDFHDLAALHAAAFAGDGRAWSAAELAELARSPGAILRVAADRGGFALARVSADEAEILTIAVDPARRRRGIGRGLLAESEAAARAAGAATMLLEVAASNAAARALYDGAGYRPVGRRPGYYGRGRDALVLSKDL